MARLLIILTACVAVVHNLNNFLVQGRADTLRVLRKIMREREAKIIPADPFEMPVAAWQPVEESESTASFTTTLENMETTGPSNTESTPKKKVTPLPRLRRHISNAVIESGQCEHIDLMDCSDFETNEMTCMITLSGMTCCVCTGRLREAKWSLF